MEEKRPHLILQPAAVGHAINYDPSDHRIETWVTKEHLHIPIVNLTDDHLDGIIKLFKRRPGWRENQRPLIFAEKKKRIQQKLAKESVAGNILYGKSE